jgi:hypothetical protein
VRLRPDPSGGNHHQAGLWLSRGIGPALLRGRYYVEPPRAMLESLLRVLRPSLLGEEEIILIRV